MFLIFCISLAVIFYTYIGYGLLLILLTLFKQNHFVVDENFTPKVSLIITAFNEEKDIEHKIEESLALNYPKDKLEIIIASDASTDRTDEIVRTFADSGLRLIRNPQRSGKTATQNYAIKQLNSDVLVFSDATTRYEKDAVKNLVRHLCDPKVGCVAGREMFLQRNGMAKQASFFWRYELFLRKFEGKFYSLIGVSGCIFAIRRECYEYLGADLIEDFALPLKVVSKGLRVVYEPKAIGYEEAVADIKDEFIRKVRIVIGGLNVVFTMRYLLNPFRYPSLSFQLVSHKVLRWLAPFFLGLLLVSNLFLLFQSWGYFLTGVLQMIFYFSILMVHLVNDKKKVPKILKIFYHFIVINMSAFVGIYNYCRGERNTLWTPVR